MLGNFDLHIHTTASDGSDTPRELAGKLAGLALFSVTDHDTVEGALAMETLVPEGVRYLRGVEFTCISPAGKCHILGYNYDPDCPQFRIKCKIHMHHLILHHDFYGCILFFYSKVSTSYT